MNIMFMTKFKDGSFTGFREKILKGFYPVSRKDNIDLIVHRIVNPPIIWPKLHTIRKSGRIRLGMKLSLREWSGLPYRSKQDIIIDTNCKLVQKIRVCQNSFGRFVYIDDREEPLPEPEVERLARNDGFENADQFFSWFGFDFSGHIIHWSSVVY